MARRADTTLLGRIQTADADLKQLEIDLMRFGDRELAKVVKRARRELLLPARTGAVNTLGVNADAVRR
jgi:hypothetical protein